MFKKKHSYHHASAWSHFKGLFHLLFQSFPVSLQDLVLEGRGRIEEQSLALLRSVAIAPFRIAKLSSCGRWAHHCINLFQGFPGSSHVDRERLASAKMGRSLLSELGWIFWRLFYDLCPSKLHSTHLSKKMQEWFAFASIHFKMKPFWITASLAIISPLARSSSSWSHQFRLQTINDITKEATAWDISGLVCLCILEHSLDFTLRQAAFLTRWTKHFWEIRSKVKLVQIDHVKAAWPKCPSLSRWWSESLPFGESSCPAGRQSP